MTYNNWYILETLCNLWFEVPLPIMVVLPENNHINQYNYSLSFPGQTWSLYELVCSWSFHTGQGIMLHCKVTSELVWILRYKSADILARKLILSKISGLSSSISYRKGGQLPWHAFKIFGLTLTRNINKTELTAFPSVFRWLRRDNSFALLDTPH